jgi:hypothetical protein
MSGLLPCADYWQQLIYPLQPQMGRWGVLLYPSCGMGEQKKSGAPCFQLSVLRQKFTAGCPPPDAARLTWETGPVCDLYHPARMPQDAFSGVGHTIPPRGKREGGLLQPPSPPHARYSTISPVDSG